jgi:hypothetical protein
VVVLLEAAEVAIKVVQTITLHTIHINQMAAIIHKFKALPKTKVRKDKARQLATTVLMVSRILPHT